MTRSAWTGAATIALILTLACYVVGIFPVLTFVITFALLGAVLWLELT